MNFQAMQLPLRPEISEIGSAEALVYNKHSLNPFSSWRINKMCRNSRALASRDQVSVPCSTVHKIKTKLHLPNCNKFIDISLSAKIV